MAWSFLCRPPRSFGLARPFNCDLCVHTQSVSEEQEQQREAGTRLTAKMISTAWVLSSSDDSGGASDVAEGWHSSHEGGTCHPGRSHFLERAVNRCVLHERGAGAPRFVDTPSREHMTHTISLQSLLTRRRLSG